MIDTTTRTYRAAERPRVTIKGWEKQEVYLTRINSKTAYFRGPYFVGEMAVDVEDVLHIDEPRQVTHNGWTETPAVDSWALHKSGDLDSRPVAEVSEDGTQIKLRIHTLVTDWMPASNYEYRVDS